MADIVSAWAADKPEIKEAWLFGSRVRGDHRPDSDLDVALVMSGESEGTRLGNWFALADGWEQDLGRLLPVELDLDLGDSDISTKVVGPALLREGIRISLVGEPSAV